MQPQDFDDQIDTLSAWRRDFHAHPELTFDVHRTVGLVEERLRAMGVDEVVAGIGRTGLVGLIKGKRTDSGRVIGLRADMDALPMQEHTNLAHASKVEGKMHACGHDGHTTMLLGAAQALARSRDFNGTVALIFQPAEEAEKGGLAMVEDGLMDRFGIQKVFALHTKPGMPLGHFGTCAGGILGSADLFRIDITGKGTHAALPERGIDPALAVAQLVTGLQTIVSRNIATSDRLVVSVTQIHMGTSDNIIADDAWISGTVRSLTRGAPELAEKRMGEICRGVAEATGTQIDLTYEQDLPVTYNDPDATRFAIEAARRVVPAHQIDEAILPAMGGEDFSFMLEKCPGAFMWIGNGDSADLHNPAFDFNDSSLPYGAAYFVSLAENYLR